MDKESIRMLKYIDNHPNDIFGNFQSKFRDAENRLLLLNKHKLVHLGLAKISDQTYKIDYSETQVSISIDGEAELDKLHERWFERKLPIIISIIALIKSFFPEITSIAEQLLKLIKL